MMKRIFCLLLILVVLSAAVLTGCAAAGTDGYSINEAYAYPVLPGTSEWEALSTLQEKIDACHVPPETLENMTTEALVETVLNYPLLINIYAFNTVELGIASVSSYFSGINELLGREDARAVLSAYRAQYAANATDTDVTLLYCDTLLEYISAS